MHRLGCLLIGLLILTGCESKRDVLVSWIPEDPCVGESIEIFYNPGFQNAKIAEPQNPKLIFETIFPESTQVQVLPLKNHNDLYSAKVKIESRARVIGFKFEDINGLSDDHNLRGWNLLVKDEDGNLQADSYYLKGKIMDSSLRPHAKPDFEAALAAYKDELDSFPENYKAWLGIWQSRLKLAQNPAGFIPIVKHQLDSLIKAAPNHPEILRLAFDTYRSILPNTPKAIYYGSRYIAENTQNEKTAKIAFLLLFLKNENQPENLSNDLREFLMKYTGQMDPIPVYAKLMENYLRFKQFEKAHQTLLEIVKLNPKDFSYYVSLARSLGELGKIPEAEKYLEIAFEKCTLLASQKNEPWINGFERLIQFNIDQAGIYSNLARINFNEGKLEQSIRNRKKAIELGSPFPAYEWQLIGKTYFQMEKFENAKHAYAAALLIDPYYESAIRDLFKIYQQENGGPDSKFNDYVQELLNTHQQEFAKPAPNFEIRDAAGNLFKLADQKDKITVIYFGATILWDNHPELLEKLNKLSIRFNNRPDIDFWMISLESKNLIESYLTKQPLGFRIFPNGEKARDIFDIPGFPTYLIIDKNGFEQFRHVGEYPQIVPVLEKKIREMINLPLT